MGESVLFVKLDFMSEVIQQELELLLHSLLYSDLSATDGEEPW